MAAVHRLKSMLYSSFANIRSAAGITITLTIIIAILGAIDKGSYIIVNTIVTGGMWAIMAMGLALLFGVMNVANFTHGEFFMVGALAAYFIMTFSGQYVAAHPGTWLAGASPFLGICGATLVGSLFGAICELVVSGLSWETILKKRDAYRRAFSGFDPVKVARYTAARWARLMRDEGIVRNRLKIDSTVTNAAAFLAVQREFGSFDRFLWDFVGGKPLVSHARPPRRLPARTALSDALSKELKRRGFRFVGTTICYAFMQAVGIVNDHAMDCFRYRICLRG